MMNEQIKRPRGRPRKHPKIEIRQETEQEIENKISEKLYALRTMTRAIAERQSKALIVSGPAGLGKSYEVINTLEKHTDSFAYVKGFVGTTGLYRLLHENSAENSIIVFDDADSIFWNDSSLNLLKCACDTNGKRIISWLTEIRMEDELGDKLPRQFEFCGSIIFITNYDFDLLTAKNHKLTPHFQAMISRAHYLDMCMRTRLDYLVRIKQAIKDGLLEGLDLTTAQKIEMLNFINANSEKLRELSLRMILKMAKLITIHPIQWQTLAKNTCFKSLF